MPVRFSFLPMRLPHALQFAQAPLCESVRRLLVSGLVGLNLGDPRIENCSRKNKSSNKPSENALVMHVTNHEPSFLLTDRFQAIIILILPPS